MQLRMPDDQSARTGWHPAVAEQPADWTSRAAKQKLK